MQCNLLIIVLLSYAVEAYTFTQAIAIELLRHFRSVHNAPRALQQFVQQTLTGCPLVRVRCNGAITLKCPLL